MKLPPLFNSIRARLLMWMGTLLALVLGGFGFTAYELHRRNQLDQIDAQLEQRITYLAAIARRPPGVPGPGGRAFGGGVPPPPELRDDPNEIEMRRRGPGQFGDGPLPRVAPRRDDSPERQMFGPRRREAPLELRHIELTGEALRLFDEGDTNSFYYAIWSRGGTLLKTSTNVVPGLLRPTQVGRIGASGVETREEYREAWRFTDRGDCVLVGISLADHFGNMRRFLGRLGLAGGGVLALGLGGAWWLATRSIKPLDRISATANRIAAGNLSERIDAADTVNELARLAGVLNSTFARLDTAFTQQKQFTADASHELRTPLAVIISESQTALSRPRAPEDYRDSLQVCHDAAQQMRRVADSLLELARFDAGQEQPRREEVDLGQIARDCANLVRSLAREKNVTLECDSRNARVLGDPMRLGQVLTNLLQNAVHYNKPGGRVRVETFIEGTHAIVTVEDTGIGIAPEDLPRIFDRFYRADKARARSEGHVGLGLAIAKSIVEMHGGAITITSVPSEQTVFRIKIPATHAVASTNTST